MIKRITMKNCASYDGTGVIIDGCDRVNFIYGHNGSGKSTISNFLSSLTELSEQRFMECSIDWEVGTQSSILVYNKSFRERNLQASDMPGVFTLGESTVEQITLLENLRNEHELRIKEKRNRSCVLESKKQDRERLLAEYESAVWEQILKRNEEIFKDAFTGLRSKKSAFFVKIRELIKQKPTTKRTREDIENSAAILFGKKPEKLIELPYPDFTVSNEIESSEIWGKVIVGSRDVDIAGLIETLDISAWVQVGQEYIQETDICPFCQNHTITADLKAKFAAYFNEDYKRQIDMLINYEQKYRLFSESISLILKQLLEDVSKLTIDIDISVLQIKVAEYLSLVANNISIISAKRSEANRSLTMSYSSCSAEEIITILHDINTRIAHHNSMVEHFKTEKEALIDAIWGLLLSENKGLISGYESKLNGIEKAIASIENSLRKSDEFIADLDNQIVEANKNITSVQPTVDAINRSLKAYGIEGFSIVSSPIDPNRYQIQRPNGEIAAETLSEGEETFISFLYFIYRVQGGLDQESISKHKVIVIDDPICSLDSSVLYVVSSLVRDLVGYAKNGVNNIDQIFVLTHNVYFHKEISFIDGRDKEDSKTKFWILKKKNEVSFCTPFERKNPIKTTYALLWSEVKENNEISVVSLQNAMRRILENFFGTLGNANSTTILQFFESPEEKAICRSLFSWANDGSHSIPDDLEFSENTDAPDKYRKVFKDIFYRTHNQYHYDRMME